MGWSSTAMAARYQHVTDPIRRQVAGQIGGLLWASNIGLRPSTETETETTATLVTDRQDRPPSITAGQRGGGYGI